MPDADATPCDRYEPAVAVEEATGPLETRMHRQEAEMDRLGAALDRLEVRLDRLERLMRRWMIVVVVGSTAWTALMIYLKRGGG